MIDVSIPGTILFCPEIGVDVAAAETVDRLPRITYHKYTAVRAVEHGFENLILHGIGILKFIDDTGFEFFLQFFQQFSGIFQCIMNQFDLIGIGHEVIGAFQFGETFADKTDRFGFERRCCIHPEIPDALVLFEKQPGIDDIFDLFLVRA